MVAVIGAGIIGLSCAWRLARQGLPVTVFDAKTAASDASWAAAGMLAPGSEMDGAPEVSEFGVRSARAWPEFVRELQAESNCEIDYRQCPGVEYPEDPADRDRILDRIQRQAGLNLQYAHFSLGGHEYWVHFEDAAVDPRDVTRALLVANRQLGVTIREQEPIVAIENNMVLSAIGEYPCDSVVISAGARSSSLFPNLPATRPVKGYLMSWKLEPGALATILRRGHTYIFQRKSGLVIAGSTTEEVGWDATINPAIAAWLRARAVRLCPALNGIEPEECWIGFRPGIAAPGPAIGRIPATRVWTAFGHYRNGILMAPETARMIAEQIAESG